MNAVAGWGLAAVALLLGGLWMPALAIAVVAAVFSAAKPEPATEDHAPTESEEVATLDVRAWEEASPARRLAENAADVPLVPQSYIDAGFRLGAERMRYREPLLGECSVHDCPDCGEGLVSVRVHDGHRIKRCEQCHTK